MTMPTPAATGRGAWSLRGNAMNRAFYVKDCSTTTQTQDAYAVRQGVLAIQKLLGMDYSTGPGTFGPKTDAAVRSFQTAAVPPADGVVGRNTMRALLRPPIARIEAEKKIPGHLLWGLVGAESDYDPGAVGYTTPYDLGLVQINLQYNPGVSPEQAFDPTFALNYAADRMLTAYNKFRLLTTNGTIAWNGAVLDHHAPAWAVSYVKSGGVWPNDRSSLYVSRVKTFASTF